MKQLKRSLALMLAVAVLAGLFVTSASAKGVDPVEAGDMHIADYIDVTEKNNAEAIYALTALGIFEGYTGADEGKFKPEATITRAEFAKIVYFLSGNTEDELGYYEAKATAFGDVAEGHWAEGYINACAEQGLYVGYPDGTFRPTVNLTKQQVVTVLLRMLGYDDNLPGNWPYDYITKAKNIGLVALNGFAGTQDADRDTVAKLSYDVLFYSMVSYVDNEITQGLGYVAGTVDADGYAYLMMKTNEGYEDLLLAKHALGAELVMVNYMPHYCDYEDQYSSMYESAAWGFEDFEEGELELAGVWVGGFAETNVFEAIAKVLDSSADIIDELIAAMMNEEDVYDLIADIIKDDVLFVDMGAMPLASNYYIYGGQLVDLGDNIGAMAIVVDEEVVFATAGEKPAGFFSARGHNYYGHFEDEPFGIVEDQDDSYTYFHEDTDWGDYIVENAKLNAYEDHVYFNMTTREFIDAEDLNKGDVVYYAGWLYDDETDLFLVYNPVKGDYTEFDEYPEEDAFVEIDKKSYTTYNWNSFFSMDEGVSYHSFRDIVNGKATNNILEGVVEFGDVEYVVAYNTTDLAYMRKDLRDTYVYGVIVDYQLTSLGLYWDPSANAGKGGYNELWQISGIELLLPDGSTKIFNLTETYDEVADTETYYGDLVTLMYTAKGYVVYTEDDNDDETLYGWYYDTDETYNKVAKSGASRLAIEWAEDNGFASEDEYEVYTTNNDTIAFYVEVKVTDFTNDRAKVTAKVLDQDELLAAGGDYDQALPFRFYNKDETGLNVLYLTAKEGTSDKVNTYYVGLATKFTKRADDNWAITIDGTRYTTAKDCTYGTAEDLDEIEVNLVSEPTFVLYQLDKNGKIWNIEFVADYEYVAGQYEDDTAFELSNNGKPNYELITVEIEDVTFTRGDKRIEIEDGYVDYDTLYTESATVINLKNGKTLDAASDLQNLVDDYNNGDYYEFVIIYEEATNDVLYILAVNGNWDYVA